jgi:hypothetical protein
MPTLYYLLIVEGDVEPLLLGPYKSFYSRDRRARAEKATRGDHDGIFWLDVTNNKPKVGAFCGIDLDPSLGATR